jgi:hypothetical protein
MTRRAWGEETAAARRRGHTARAVVCCDENGVCRLPAAKWHGTLGGYTNHLCVCPGCRAARSEYRAPGEENRPPSRRRTPGKLTGPWREVTAVEGPHEPTGFLGRQPRWWTFTLSCGHTTDRRVQYRPVPPGQTQRRRSASDILPSAQKRARCPDCPS